MQSRSLSEGGEESNMRLLRELRISGVLLSSMRSVSREISLRDSMRRYPIKRGTSWTFFFVRSVRTSEKDRSAVLLLPSSINKK